MKASATQIATALRELADLIESDQIVGEEIVILSCDAWADVDVHLTPGAFLARTHGESFNNDHGHLTLSKGGRRYVCVQDGPPSLDMGVQTV